MPAQKLKKVLVAVLAAAILFSIFPAAVFAAYENTHVNTGDKGFDIIEIAETQIGYTEGNDGYTKYGEYYGHPYTDWCGAFIVWCAAQANVSTSVIPFNGSSNGLKDFFNSRGLYYTAIGHGGSYSPKTGDIAFMSASNSPGDITHVGLVAGYSGGVVTTIEGNYGDKVTQVTYNKDTKKIVGYASPLYGYRIGYYRLDSTMRLRARATTESDKLTTIPYDTVVNITKIDGDWGYVTYDGYTGWMNLNYSTYLVQDDTVRIPETALFLVADVSQWNPASRFDWEQLKENGVEAVIMRIGGRGYNADKTLYRDTAFLQHYKNAKAAGLHVGVYFFSYALTRAQAKEEAQMTIDILAENNCVLDMPVFIDIEDLSYDHQHEWAGKEVCSMVANTFCDTIADAGYYPGIYCNKYFAENLLDANVFAGRAAWIAHWGVAQCG